MHAHPIHTEPHAHTFGQDHRKPGERRTLIVIALTATTMVVEIAFGIISQSMALLADGLHMGSHTVALGIAAFAYMYARRHADDKRFTFGTGKVNALAGFAGAILLLFFAVVMAVESVERFLHPVSIVFDQAIAVAVIGLIVNGLSVLILNHRGQHPDSHSHHHGHKHADHNLRSAYLHVLADALTSVLAIVALLAGKFLGAVWLDPVMGVVGALLVANWSRGLLKESGGVLLDRRGPDHVREAIMGALEDDPRTQVTDLHIWSIGPEIYAAEIALVTDDPKPPEHYKSALPGTAGLVHVTVEIRRRTEGA